MKIRFATILKITAVLVVGLVVTAVAILMTMDFSAYKNDLQTAVKNATGRDLTIAGAFEPKIGLTPSIEVRNVRFANAPWGSQPDMARVDRFRAELELLPLLTGTLRIRRIVLIGADVLLETGSDGKANWVMSPAGTSGRAETPSESGGSATIPVIEDLAIENTRLTFRDGAAGTETRLAVERLDATTDGATSPIALDARFAVNDAPVSVSGSVGSLSEMLAGAKWPVDITVEGGGARLAIKGAIDDPRRNKGVALAVSAEGDNLALLSPLARTSVPALGPYEFSANVADDGASWKLTGLQATLGKSDISGFATVNPSAKPPRLTANLTSALIRLQDVSPPDDGGKQAAPSGGVSGGKALTSDGRVFPDDPLPLDGLKAADATVDLRIERLEGDGIALGDVAMKLALRDGDLRLDPMSLGVADGKLTGTVGLRTSRAKPELAIDLRSTGIDLARLSAGGDKKALVEGRLNTTARLSGAGSSVRAFMAGLDGRIETTMEGGRITDETLDLLSTDVLKVINPFATKEKGLAVNCVVGRYDVKNGQLASRITLLDTSRAQVTGEGGVNLATEEIDFLIRPQAKEKSLVSLAIPLRVGGTLAAPSVYPDPAGVARGAVGAVTGVLTGAGGIVGSLVGLSEGAADDNPCIAALQGRETPAGTAPADKSGAGDGVERTLDDVGKGIEKGLKGLFGQ